MNSIQTVIVLPSLNPDQSIIALAKALRQACDYPLIIVNDGSDTDRKNIFAELSTIENTVLLMHEINLGKGRALKTAFDYALKNYPGLTGAVTADGDGQHRVEDIIKCAHAMEQHPDKFILGVRNFNLDHVPWKSRFGNLLTSWIFRSMLGLKISDTQTGLRGIPAAFMEILLEKPGERFEFETRMLIESADNHNPKTFPIYEVVIATVYEDNNRGTHFRPIVDSLKIYRIVFKALFGRLLLFGCSGLLSAILDQGLFALLFYWAIPALKLPPLILSVIISRSISLVFNYLVNRNLVFGGKERYIDGKTFGSYLALCAVIMASSYALVKVSTLLLPGENVLIAKIMIDAMLFFASYKLQSKIIFR